MELFEAEGLTFEKVANVELEEDATQWPRQVLTELFRVLPEISEYTPDVKFIRTNEEQGYAVGVVVVTNSTNSAIAAPSSPATPQPPRALIPIVVKNGKLSPLDILMTSSGKMYPLTVERLREALYRPESFELITEDWGDNALWSIFAPPGTSQGFGTGTGMGGLGGAGGIQYLAGPGLGGGVKMASLIDMISDSLLEPDLAAFTSKLADDPQLLRSAALNGAMAEALQKLARITPVSTKTAEAYEATLDELSPADVALMRYDADSDLYAVKTACRSTGLQRVQYFDRGEFLRFAGDKVAARVDTEGSVVASAASNRAVIVAGPSGEQPKRIERSGHYTVFNAITGAALKGCVAVGLIDTQGARLPVSLFIHPLGASVQDQIAGTLCYGEREPIPNEPPKGRGCFLVEGDGISKLNATVELTVQGSSSDGVAINYNCVDITGEQLTVTLQRGMRSIAAFPQRKQLIMPYNTKFVSTESPAPPLVTSAPEAEKAASALLQGKLIVTAAPGEVDAFRMQFRQLPKLAAAVPDSASGLDYDQALYALCVAGLGPQDAYRALTKVAHEGRCEIAVYEDLGGPRIPDVAKIADHVVALRELRPGLVKEAAALPDAMTVDAVLSLDFINSENVRVFICMIPYLEKALNKICELVFAARLGLTEIPETAAARAARGLNDAVRGLKSLALRQIEELP